MAQTHRLKDSSIMTSFIMHKMLKVEKHLCQMAISSQLAFSSHSCWTSIDSKMKKSRKCESEMHKTQLCTNYDGTNVITHKSM